MIVATVRGMLCVGHLGAAIVMVVLRLTSSALMAATVAVMFVIVIHVPVSSRFLMA